MKRRSLLGISLIVFFIVAIESCKYDNVEELSPFCDTSQVTYSATIVPILQKNCYGCHGSDDEIVLQDYNVLKTYAADGKLYGNVAHLPNFNPMPKGGNKLSDCDIAKIKNWVDTGYPND